MKVFDEVFNGYCFTALVESDACATNEKIVAISNSEELGEFLTTNVTRYPELRVVGKNDETVLHVVNRELVFPVPDRGQGKRNLWSETQKKFLEVKFY